MITGMLLLVAVAVMPNPGSERLLHRRSGVEPLPIRKVEVSTEGLRVTTPTGAQQVVPWDRIARLEPTDQGLLETGVAPRIELGTSLWRGYRRLLRGDARLARPEFIKAWETLQGTDANISALAAEGMVRSAIARSRPVEAMVPGLALAGLRTRGFGTDRFDGLEPVMDPETGLVPLLPPVVEPSDASLAAENLVAWSENAEPADRMRADLVRRLLLRIPPDGEDASSGEDEGVRFLRQLLELESDDPARRARARERLVRGIDNAPGWKEAWIRFFIGRSLVDREDDPVLRRVGVLELLHVPPLGNAAPVTLADRSLVLAANTLRELGDVEEAELLDALVRISDSNGSLETTP